MTEVKVMKVQVVVLQGCITLQTTAESQNVTVHAHMYVQHHVQASAHCRNDDLLGFMCGVPQGTTIQLMLVVFLCYMSSQPGSS